MCSAIVNRKLFLPYKFFS